MTDSLGPMRKIMRFTAGITLFFFVTTSHAWGVTNPVVSPALEKLPLRSFSTFEIPSELGQIVNLTNPSRPDGVRLVLIQDAHAVQEVQETIQKMIDYLGHEYGIPVVALEGAEGTLDPTLYRSFPDAFLREKVMKDYFSRGEMTGVEMAAVLNPEGNHFEGLETWDLYEKNYAAYLESVETKPALLEKLKAERKTLDSQREKIYSKELNQIHNWIESLAHSDLKFFSDFEFQNSDLNKYPQLWKFLMSFPLASAKFDSSTGEAGRKRESSTEDPRFHGDDSLEATELLSLTLEFKKKYFRRLNLEDQKKLEEKYQAFQTGLLNPADFLGIMQGFGEKAGARLKLNASLEKLNRTSQMLASLQSSKLFEEIEAFLLEQQSKQIKTPEQKEISEKYRNLFLIEKLVSLELTKKQWEVAKGIGERGKGESFNPLPSVLTPMLRPFLEFYQLAEQRDAAFHKNLESILKRQKAQSAIVVAGGFHTQGFEEECKSKGYGCAVVMPNVKNLAGSENYEKLMRGQVSWNKEIRTSLFDGFARHASKKFAENLNPLEKGRALKLWHDEIIRSLSKQNRIAEAGKFTKYVDDLAKGKGRRAEGQNDSPYALTPMPSAAEILWKQFEMQFDSFSKELSQLIQEKRLTVSNVQAALDRVSALKPSMLGLDAQKLVPNSVLKLDSPIRLSKLGKFKVRAEVRSSLMFGDAFDFKINASNIELSEEEVLSYLGEEALRSVTQHGDRYFIQRLNRDDFQAFVADWQEKIFLNKEWQEKWLEPSNQPNEKLPFYPANVSDDVFGLIQERGGRPSLLGNIGLSFDPVGFDFTKKTYTWKAWVTQFETPYHNPGEEKQRVAVQDLLFDFILKANSQDDRLQERDLSYKAINHELVAYAKRRGLTSVYEQAWADYSKYSEQLLQQTVLEKKLTDHFNGAFQPDKPLLEKYRGLARQAAKKIVERVGPEGGIISMDAPSGAGKSSIWIELIRQELSKLKRNTAVVGLDMWLAARPWRQAVQKMVVGEPLTDSDLDWLKQLSPDLLKNLKKNEKFLGEESFFQNEKIKEQILKPLAAFYESGQDHLEIHLEGVYDQKTKKNDGARDLKFQRGDIVIVEGKYANHETFLPFFKFTLRLKDNSELILQRFVERTKTLSPEDAQRQETFYRLSLGPSYDENYAPRTLSKIDLVIDISEDPWRLDFMNQRSEVRSNLGGRRMEIPSTLDLRPSTSFTRPEARRQARDKRGEGEGLSGSRRAEARAISARARERYEAGIVEIWTTSEKKNVIKPEKKELGMTGVIIDADAEKYYVLTLGHILPLRNGGIKGHFRGSSQAIPGHIEYIEKDGATDLSLLSFSRDAVDQKGSIQPLSLSQMTSRDLQKSKSFGVDLVYWDFGNKKPSGKTKGKIKVHHYRARPTRSGFANSIWMLYLKRGPFGHGICGTPLCIAGEIVGMNHLFIDAVDQDRLERPDIMAMPVPKLRAFLSRAQRYVQWRKAYEKKWLEGKPLIPSEKINSKEESMEDHDRRVQNAWHLLDMARFDPVSMDDDTKSLAEQMMTVTRIAALKHIFASGMLEEDFLNDTADWTPEFLRKDLLALLAWGKDLRMRIPSIKWVAVDLAGRFVDSEAEHRKFGLFEGIFDFFDPSSYYLYSDVNGPYWILLEPGVQNMDDGDDFTGSRIRHLLVPNKADRDAILRHLQQQKYPKKGLQSFEHKILTYAEFIHLNEEVLTGPAGPRKALLTSTKDQGALEQTLFRRLDDLLAGKEVHFGPRLVRLLQQLLEEKQNPLRWLAIEIASFSNQEALIRRLTEITEDPNESIFISNQALYALRHSPLPLAFETLMRHMEDPDLQRQKIALYSLSVIPVFLPDGVVQKALDLYHRSKRRDVRRLLNSVTTRYHIELVYADRVTLPEVQSVTASRPDLKEAFLKLRKLEEEVNQSHLTVKLAEAELLHYEILESIAKEIEFGNIRLMPAENLRKGDFLLDLSRMTYQMTQLGEDSKGRFILYPSDREDEDWQDPRVIRKNDFRKIMFLSDVRAEVREEVVADERKTLNQLEGYEELSTRTQNDLNLLAGKVLNQPVGKWDYGKLPVSSLTRLTTREILNRRDVGPTTLKELQNFLHKHAQYFLDEAPNTDSLAALPIPLGKIEAMKQAGIFSISDFQAKTDEELLKIKGFGARSLQEARAWLSARSEARVLQLVTALQKNKFKEAKQFLDQELANFKKSNANALGTDQKKLISIFKPLIAFIEKDTPSENQLKFIEEYLKELKNNGLRLDAPIEVIQALIVRKRTGIEGGKADLQTIQNLNGLMRQKLLSGSQRRTLRRISLLNHNNGDKTNSEIVKIFNELREIILFEDSADTLPQTSRDIFEPVFSSHLENLRKNLQEDIAGSDFLLDERNQPFVYQFNDEAAVTQPYFAIVMDRTGVPVRMVLKSKEKKQSVDFASHLTGAKLQTAIHVPSAWITEGKNTIYIREIKGREITDVIFDLKSFSPEIQKRFFTAFGVAMSEAYLLGMADRARNLIVSMERFQNTQNSDLVSLENRVMFNIDRENVLNPEYLNKQPLEDLEEASEVFARWAHYLLPGDRDLFLKYLPDYLNGFASGYRDTKNYFSKHDEKISQQIQALTVPYNPAFAAAITQRLMSSDDQIGQLTERIKAEILKKFEDRKDYFARSEARAKTLDVNRVRRMIDRLKLLSFEDQGATLQERAENNEERLHLTSELNELRKQILAEKNSDTEYESLLKAMSNAGVPQIGRAKALSAGDQNPRAEVRQSRVPDFFFDNFYVRKFSIWFKDRFSIMRLSPVDLSGAESAAEKISALKQIVADSNQHQILDTSIALLSGGILLVKMLGALYGSQVTKSMFSTVLFWATPAISIPTVIIMLGAIIVHRSHQVRAEKILRILENRQTAGINFGNQPRAEVRKDIYSLEVELSGYSVKFFTEPKDRIRVNVRIPEENKIIQDDFHLNLDDPDLIDLVEKIDDHLLAAPSRHNFEKILDGILAGLISGIISLPLSWIALFLWLGNFWIVSILSLFFAMGIGFEGFRAGFNHGISLKTLFSPQAFQQSHKEIVMEAIHDFYRRVSSLKYSPHLLPTYPETIFKMEQEYGLSDVKVTPIQKIDKKNIWQVTSNEGNFILKEPKYRNTADLIDWESSVLQKLGDHRAAQIKKTVKGKNFIEHNGRIYILYEAIQGEEFNWGEIEGQKLNEAAHWLASMHKDLEKFIPAGKDYYPAERPQVIGVLNYELGLKRIEALNKQIEERGPPFAPAEQIFLDNFSFIQTQMANLRKRLTPDLLSRLPVTIMHGDFHQANGRYQSDGSFKAFDFEYASREARVRDLANPFELRFHEGKSREDVSLAFDKVETFLKTYHSFNPLSREEIQILPEVFRLAYLEGIMIFAGEQGQKIDSGTPLKEQVANLKIIDSLDWQKLSAELEVTRPFRRAEVRARQNDLETKEDIEAKQRLIQLARVRKNLPVDHELQPSLEEMQRAILGISQIPSAEKRTKEYHAILPTVKSRIEQGERSAASVKRQAGEEEEEPRILKFPSRAEARTKNSEELKMKNEELNSAQSQLFTHHSSLLISNSRSEVRSRTGVRDTAKTFRSGRSEARQQETVVELVKNGIEYLSYSWQHYPLPTLIGGLIATAVVAAFLEAWLHPSAEKMHQELQKVQDYLTKYPTWSDWGSLQVILKAAHFEAETLQTEDDSLAQEAELIFNQYLRTIRESSWRTDLFGGTVSKMEALAAISRDYPVYRQKAINLFAELKDSDRWIANAAQKLLNQMESSPRSEARASKDIESSWPIFHSNLEVVDHAFQPLFDGKNLSDIVLEKIRQLNANQTLTILDWGAGDGTALIGLAEKIKQKLGEENFHKVRLFGFGDQNSENWELGRKMGIHFIQDAAENLPNHFKEKEIDIIFSHWGMTHLSNKEQPFQEYLNHLKQISFLLKGGGFLIQNKFGKNVLNLSKVQRDKFLQQIRDSFDLKFGPAYALPPDTPYDEEDLWSELVLMKRKNRSEVREQTQMAEAQESRMMIYGGADDRGPGASSYLLEYGHTKLLLDAGEGSGERIRKNPPAQVDAILLSHAHNDHSGDIPAAAALFPNAPILATEPTAVTSNLMAEDSVTFRSGEAKKEFQKAVKEAKKQYLPLESGTWYQINDETKILFMPASHIWGANLTYIATPYGNYLYTGDFSGEPIRGHETLELLPDFPVDQLWMESTYGLILREKSREEREKVFAESLAKILNEGGTVLIPTFAIGRTSDVILTIRHYQEKGVIPKTPIYVDGLAALNLESYMRFLAESTREEDQELYRLLDHDQFSIEFVNEGLRYDLMGGRKKGPFMILGGSGSLEGGRSVQYLPGIAKEKANAVFLVGHQFEGSIGAQLKQGEKNLTVEGKPLAVKAEIQVHDFGAHADQNSLLALAETVNPKQIHLVHGELPAKQKLKNLLEARGFLVHIPKTGDQVRENALSSEQAKERRDFFESLPALPLPEHGGEISKQNGFIEVPEQYKISSLLAALGQNNNQANRKMIEQLVEKKKQAASQNALRDLEQEIRGTLDLRLKNLTLKRSREVRQRYWDELVKPLNPPPMKFRKSAIKVKKEWDLDQRIAKSLDEPLGWVRGFVDSNATPRKFILDAEGHELSSEKVRETLKAYFDQAALESTADLQKKKWSALSRDLRDQFIENGGGLSRAQHAWNWLAHQMNGEDHAAPNLGEAGRSEVRQSKEVWTQVFQQFVGSENPLEKRKEIFEKQAYVKSQISLEERSVILALIPWELLEERGFDPSKIYWETPKEFNQDTDLPEGALIIRMISKGGKRFEFNIRSRGNPKYFAEIGLAVDKENTLRIEHGHMERFSVLNGRSLLGYWLEHNLLPFARVFSFDSISILPSRIPTQKLKELGFQGDAARPGSLMIYYLYQAAFPELETVRSEVREEKLEYEIRSVNFFRNGTGLDFQFQNIDSKQQGIGTLYKNGQNGEAAWNLRLEYSGPRSAKQYKVDTNLQDLSAITLLGELFESSSIDFEDANWDSLRRVLPLSLQRHFSKSNEELDEIRRGMARTLYEGIEPYAFQEIKEKGLKQIMMQDSQFRYGVETFLSILSSRIWLSSEDKKMILEKIETRVGQKELDTPRAEARSASSGQARDAGALPQSAKGIEQRVNPLPSALAPMPSRAEVRSEDEDDDQEMLTDWTALVLGQIFLHEWPQKDWGRAPYFIVDGPSGIGKSTLMRAFHDIMKKSGYEMVYLNLDMFLIDRAKRYQIIEAILKGEIDPKTFDERTFFDEKKIQDMLSKINQFRASRKKSFKLVIPQAWDPSIKAYRDMSFTIKSNSLVLVEGKYAHTASLRNFYGEKVYRLRIKKNMDTVRRQLKEREAPFRSDDEMTRYMKFYDLVLAPSYLRYAEHPVRGLRAMTIYTPDDDEFYERSEIRQTTALPRNAEGIKQRVNSLPSALAPRSDIKFTELMPTAEKIVRDIQSKGLPAAQAEWLEAAMRKMEALLGTPSAFAETTKGTTSLNELREVVPFDLKAVKALLNRPDLLAKHFKLSENQPVVVDGEFVRALIDQFGKEAVAEALQKEFLHATIVYQQGVKEQEIHNLVRGNLSKFSEISYQDKKLIKPNQIEKEGKPQVWTGNKTIFDFSKDPEAKKRLTDLGFAMKLETFSSLMAQGLSLKELVIFLKLLSTPELLRENLPQNSDGFRVITDSVLTSSLQALAALWSQEMLAAKQLQAAA